MNIYDLFESIDIIVDSRLKALPLEKTLLCTIVAIDSAHKGVYMVKYEADTFQAECSHLNLAIGDEVYVNVPKNNYIDAYIISKKVTGSQYNFSNEPLKYFANMSSYSIANPTFANSNQCIQTLLTWEESQLQSQVINETEQYTHVALSFELKTKLSNHNLKNYGFRLYLRTMAYDDSSHYNLHECLLTNNEILTQDTYNIVQSLKVEKLFTLAKNEQIVDMQLMFFTDFEVSSEDVLEITNIQVAFGYDINSYETESLYLYTIKNNEYQYNGLINETLQQTLRLRWIYQDELGYKVVTKNNITYCPDQVKIIWQRLKDNQWVEECVYYGAEGLSHTLTLEPFKEKEQIRVNIEYEQFNGLYPKTYTSNTITLNNVNVFNFNKIITSMSSNSTKNDFSDCYNFNGFLIDTSLKIESWEILTEAPIDLGSLTEELKSKMALQLRYTLPKNNTTAIRATTDSVTSNEYMTFREDFDLSSYSYIYKYFYRPPEKEPISPFGCIGENGAIQHSFNFCIKDIYQYQYINNNIQIELSVILDNETVLTLANKVNLTFPKKNNQSNYMMQIFMYNTLDSSQKVYDDNSTPYIVPGVTNEVKGIVYDKDGKEIALNKSIVWSWFRAPNNPNNNPIILDLAQLAEDGVFSNRCLINCLKNLDVTDESFVYSDERIGDLFYILQGEYSISSTETVKGLLPIAIKLKEDEAEEIVYFNGPNNIVYDSFGTHPTLYDQSIFLSHKTNPSAPMQKKENIYAYFNAQGIEITEKDKKLGYPYLDKSTNKLIPNNIYVDGLGDGIGIYFYNNYNSDSANKERLIPYWVQPIIIIKEQSELAYLNDWNGTTTVNSSKGTVFSPIIGAGKKNDDNTFSGVLLGDIKNSYNKNNNQTGLYGLDHSEYSYGLRQDGTAFFGKPGQGSIEFGGNEGIIYSGNFDGSVITLADKVLYDNYLADGTNYKSYWISGSSSSTTNTLTINIDENLQISHSSKNDNLIFEKIKISAPKSIEYYFGLEIQNNGSILKPLKDNTYLLEVTYKINFDLTDYDIKKLVFGLFAPSKKQINGYFNIMTKNQDTGEDQQTNSSRMRQWGFKQVYYNIEQEEEHESGTVVKFKYMFDIELLEDEWQLEKIYLPLASYKQTKDIYVHYYGIELQDISLGEVVATSLGERDYSKYSGRNITTSLIDLGTVGSYFNLGSGQLVTNNGIFRGKLEAESLSVLNNIVLGNKSTGKYLEITPNGGVELGSNAINYQVNNNTIIQSGQSSVSPLLEAEKIRGNEIQVGTIKLQADSGLTFGQVRITDKDIVIGGTSFNALASQAAKIPNELSLQTLRASDYILCGSDANNGIYIKKDNIYYNGVSILPKEDINCTTLKVSNNFLCGSEKDSGVYITPNDILIQGKSIKNIIQNSLDGLQQAYNEDIVCNSLTAKQFIQLKDDKSFSAFFNVDKDDMYYLGQRMILGNLTGTFGGARYAFETGLIGQSYDYIRMSTPYIYIQQVDPSNTGVYTAILKFFDGKQHYKINLTQDSQ